MFEFPSIPCPPLERLGLIGDRRTAALVAADGTLCWMCLPNYDGIPVFGSLLDSRKGGDRRAMIALLVTFLMDLRNAKALIRIVAAAGLFWMVFMFVLTFTYYLSRHY